MLDNFIVNIRTILPITKAKSSTDRKIRADYENDESMVAFIERSVTNKINSNEATENSTMNTMRSYLNKLYRSGSTASDIDNDIMLPRVYNNNKSDAANDWESIELKAKEKLIEDIDNVVDKFARVISVNETNSPRRDERFYVHWIYPFFFWSQKRRGIYFSKSNYFHSVLIVYRNAMIERRFDDDWHWARKTIIWQKFQLQNQHANRVFNHDYKKVMVCVISFRLIEWEKINFLFWRFSR